MRFNYDKHIHKNIFENVCGRHFIVSNIETTEHLKLQKNEDIIEINVHGHGSHVSAFLLIKENLKFLCVIYHLGVEAELDQSCDATSAPKTDQYRISKWNTKMALKCTSCH